MSNSTKPSGQSSLGGETDMPNQAITHPLHSKEKKVVLPQARTEA